MNRIYRVIYNQAKNCYVVTSEFARAHTKSAGKTTRGLVIAAMTAGALLSGAGVLPLSVRRRSAHRQVEQPPYFLVSHPMW